MTLTKAAVFLFILVLIAVVSVSIVTAIANFENDTRYDVSAIITSLELFIQAAADKTAEQEVAINTWIGTTETDLNTVQLEMERLCLLAETVINPPAPTPTP